MMTLARRRHRKKLKSFRTRQEEEKNSYQLLSHKNLNMRILFLACMLFILSCKSGPTDEKIQSDLLTTLSASYPGVTAYVKDGVATLSGTCPDESCKNSSETAAKGV